jgi:hypothetical protein
MPFTPDMRRKVDQIRDYLYGGGYPDPLSNAEQLSFLFFFYMIEGIDAANLRQAKATGRDTSLFAGDWTLRNPMNAPAKSIESLVAERSPCKRGDLLPDWSDYLKAVSVFKTPSTFKDTLRRRLVNLAERGLISREGNTPSRMPVSRG